MATNQVTIDLQGRTPRQKKRRNRGKKPVVFMCPLCDSRFTDAAQLERHMPKHNNPALVRALGGEKYGGAIKLTKRNSKRLQPSFKAAKILGGSNGPNATMIEKMIGRGGAGGQWAFRALDPCAEQKTGGERIPDLTATSTVCFEGRVDRVINSPTQPTPVVNWDCLIVSMPLPEAPIWVFKKLSGGPSWGTPDVIYAPGVNYGTLKASSGTPWDTPGVPRFPTLGQEGVGYRTTYKGFSVIHNSNDLSNQGLVYGAQMRGMVGKSIHNIGNGTDQQPQLSIEKIPYDAGALVSACPNYYRGPAKHGIYVPVRFSQSTHLYEPTDWARLSNDSTVTECKQTSMVRYGFTNDQNAPVPGYPLDWGYTDGDNAILYNVSGSDNTQMGIALFTGVAHDAILDIKLRMGMEAQPSPGGGWVLFQSDAPLPDKQALEDMIVIQDQLDVAYPEHMNSLGALIPIIGAALGNLLEYGAGKVVSWFSNRYNNQANTASRF
jgi:hypothetical protein